MLPGPLFRPSSKNKKNSNLKKFLTFSQKRFSYIIFRETELSSIKISYIFSKKAFPVFQEMGFF